MKTKWIFLFTLILMATQVVYHMNPDVHPLFWGLPFWLWILIVLHALFIVLLYFFLKEKL